MSFYVYITDINAGDHEKRVRTSLGPYRPEKLPKKACYFSHSITIGISIQMDIGRCLSTRVNFGAHEIVAGKMFSRQGYLVSEAELGICWK